MAVDVGATIGMDDGAKLGMVVAVGAELVDGARLGIVAAIGAELDDGAKVGKDDGAQLGIYDGADLEVFCPFFALFCVFFVLVVFCLTQIGKQIIFLVSRLLFKHSTISCNIFLLCCLLSFPVMNMNLNPFLYIVAIYLQ